MIDKEIDKVSEVMLEFLLRNTKNVKVIDDILGEDELNSERFKEIGKSLEVRENIYAVDGGCAVLLDGASWNVSFIRVGYVHFVGRRYVGCYKEEYINFNILLKDKDNKIVSRVFKIGSLEERSYDYLFLKSNFIAQQDPVRQLIQQVPSIIMKHLEFSLLKKLIEKNLEENDILLEDSILFSPIEDSFSLLRECEKLAINKEINFVGFSKTSKIRTNYGRSIGIIGEVGNVLFPEKSWYYFPVISPDKVVRNLIVGNDMVCRFNPLSERFFRVQVVSNDVELLLRKLKFLSLDPELPGYPFPLKYVDNIVRVTNKEKENLSSLIKSKLYSSEFLRKVLYDTLSQDFHSELDKRAHK